MDANRPKMTDWPKKIWENIFDHLPFRARVNAKLVCHRWYKALLSPKYCDREKMVIRDMWPLDHIMCILSYGKKARLHYLEFQCVDFVMNRYNPAVWLARGAQIYELHLVNCTMDGETFEYVVTYCLNLRSLRWDDRENKTQICSHATLDALIRENIVRLNLWEFETTGAVSVRWLLQFRKIYPSANRRMSFFLDPCSGTDADKVGPTTPVEEKVMNVPQLSRQKLSLKFRNLTTNFLRNTLATACDLQTLREIEIYANMGRLPKNEFLQIVSKQPLLEKMSFVGAVGRMPGFGERLLATLFECCPKLGWLFVQLEGHDLMIDTKLFNGIKSSQLEYLRLVCPKIRFDAALYTRLPVDDSEKNHKLRFLGVKSRLDFNGYHVLLRNFARLDHLELDDGFAKNDECLTSLAAYHSQITSLRFVKDHSDLSERPLRRESGEKKRSLEDEKERSSNLFCNLAKFTNLKYLSIEFNREVLKEGIGEFHLPSLEYLYVRIESEDPEFPKAFLVALAKSKRLRAVCFVALRVKIPFERCLLRFCLSIENLEFLGMLGTLNGEPQTILTVDERDELFEVSPTLRVIAQSPVALKSPTDESFVSNVCDSASKRVHTYHYPHSMYSVKCSNLERYAVDWLNF